jgi:hypothetical protein
MIGGGRELQVEGNRWPVPTGQAGSLKKPLDLPLEALEDRMKMDRAVASILRLVTPGSRPDWLKFESSLHCDTLFLCPCLRSIGTIEQMADCESGCRNPSLNKLWRTGPFFFKSICDLGGLWKCWVMSDVVILCLETRAFCH